MTIIFDLQFLEGHFMSLRCLNLKLLAFSVMIGFFTGSTVDVLADEGNNDFTEYFKPVTKTKSTKSKKGRRNVKKGKKSVSMKSKNLINQASGNKYVDANAANDTGTCVYAQTNNINALNAELEKVHFASNVVNRKCSNGESLLLIATKNDNFIAFRSLLEHGANPNLENSAGVTPLHVLARTDGRNSDDMFKMLIRHPDIMVNGQDLCGYTPLMRAIEFGNVEAVKGLIKAGANTTMKNNYGQNAVTLAEQMVNAQRNEEKAVVNKQIFDIVNRVD